MNIAFFDCFSGISGDMILGSLVDIGIENGYLEEMIKRSGITDFKLESRIVRKKSIKATKVDVIAEESKVYRHLPDIYKLIEHGKYQKKIAEQISSIFLRLAEAEAKVHGTTVNKIHFHEVGAIDSVVDIFGAVIGLNKLGIEEIYSSPVSTGNGTVKCQHGIIPVPAPATIELLKDYPVKKTKIQGELTTPTGAAILTTLSSGVKELKEVIFSGSGYGAGYKDIEEQPNVLRMLTGRIEKNIPEEDVLLIEANIDDMNPEYYPYIMDKLLKNDALDVFLTPIYMKKGRPGIILSVLGNNYSLKNLSDIIFAETSTIGIRIFHPERIRLKREELEINTKFGKSKVKKVIKNDRISIVPEYEQCKKIADEQDIPLKEVYEYFQSMNHTND